MKPRKQKLDQARRLKREERIKQLKEREEKINGYVALTVLGILVFVIIYQAFLWVDNVGIPAFAFMMENDIFFRGQVYGGSIVFIWITWEVGKHFYYSSMW